MKEKRSYCTYFDAGYLDKGLAMLRSLRAHNPLAPLFVLTLDEKTREVLGEIGPKPLTLLGLEELEAAYPALADLKSCRSRAEYFWTLTPHLVEYLLDNEKLESCTYLDADLWFFGDPDILNRELDASGCQTLIVAHRFPDAPKYREIERRSGKYCVQFNTFGSGGESRRLLSWWKDRVVENCEYNTRKGSGGDQKYLEQFPAMSSDVHELSHEGGGVAFWNLPRYMPDGKGAGIASPTAIRPVPAGAPGLPGQPSIGMRDTLSGSSFPLVFYHYANIKYIGRHVANISVGRADPRLKRMIFIPYLREVERIRSELESAYGIKFGGARSVSRNLLAAFAQRYLARLRLKDFAISDIIRF